MSLNNYSKVFRTDKFAQWGFNDDKNSHGHDYVGLIYDDICFPIKDSATAILEIGVHNGYSHLLWSAFFPRANIYGCEWKAPPYPDHNRIHIVSMDAYTPVAVDYFDHLEPNGYDIIIDDGSHVPDHQLFCLQHYYRLVKPGGHLIIEDIISQDALDYLVNNIGQNVLIKVRQSVTNALPYPVFIMDVYKP